jgi:hypothetical protein
MSPAKTPDEVRIKALAESLRLAGDELTGTHLQRALVAARLGAVSRPQFAPVATSQRTQAVAAEVAAMSPRLVPALRATFNPAWIALAAVLRAEQNAWRRDEGLRRSPRLVSNRPGLPR